MRLILVFVAGCTFSAPLAGGVTPDAPPLPACPAAPAGCTSFDCPASPASCYYYCPNERSSTGANNACTAIAGGACLLTVNDAAESTCVLAAAGAGGLVYIGLRQPSGSGEPDDEWGWYCGDSSITPQPWKTGEPNNSGAFGEDCGAMDTAGLWIDVGCNETYRFVCEAPRPGN